MGTPPISHFDGAHEFLSNFWPVAVQWEGMWFDSVEHAYQAAKFPVEQRHLFRSVFLTPGQAKRLAKKLKDEGQALPGWHTTRKVQVMTELVFQKFDNFALSEMLLATGDAELIEGNTWGDRFWGTVGGEGLNCLGTILMEKREALRNRIKLNYFFLEEHPGE